MEAAAAFEALLQELSISFNKEDQEEGILRYEVYPEDADGEGFTGILYHTDEGHYLRLMAYVGELPLEDQLPMLKELLAMNGELPAGAYCMDPDEEIVYATVNMALTSLGSAQLAEAVELLFLAQDLFDQTFYPEGGAEKPEAKA
jgi:hypothetical protein